MNSLHVISQMNSIDRAVFSLGAVYFSVQEDLKRLLSKFCTEKPLGSVPVKAKRQETVKR